jgi:hypothetical protein
LESWIKKHLACVKKYPLGVLDKKHLACVKKYPLGVLDKKTSCSKLVSKNILLESWIKKHLACVKKYPLG